MTKTTMSANLLETLEIITELGIDTVGQDLRVLAIDDITLSVHEPGGDLAIISSRVSDVPVGCIFGGSGCGCRGLRTIDLGFG